MTLDEALFQYLDRHSTFRPLVPGGIHPLLAPQQTPMPFVVYGEIAYESVHHMAGAATLARTTYQLDVYAMTNRQAHAVGEALRMVLDGYRGAMGDLDIRRAVLIDRRAGREEDERGGQEAFYRVSSDYDLWHRRSVGTF